MAEPVYLLTGATGLLGECVLFEVARAHQDLRVVCLGRDSAGVSFERRLRAAIDGPSGLYLTAEERERLHRALVPITADLRAEGLGLTTEGRAELASRPIDHVLHVAALTDFRHKPHVAARLEAANVTGTQRLIDLVNGLSSAPRSLAFVSSAYSCGQFYGAISPSFTPPELRFQNPYQRSKLEAEQRVCAAFESGPTHLRVFRPTVIGGRLDAAPAGYVTKYDVYLGWASFFLHSKKQSLGARSWGELLDSRLEREIRIAANPELGLNIVPTDFVAKTLVGAVVSDHRERRYHVAAHQDLPIGPMLDRMLECVGFSGQRYVERVPGELNEIEAAYYASVGLLYTPYIALEEPWVFERESMIALCEHAGIEPRGISTLDEFDVMLEFAQGQHWGLEL
ncbi:MAG: SDR family oxidoreductase [Myxococcota bacterium]